MKRKIDKKGISELIRKPGTGKWYVRFGGKEYGPWDKLDEKVQFSPDGKHWAIRGELHDKYYVLTDSHKYGPFNFNIKGPMFDPSLGVFVFTAQRDNEFFLVAGGEVIRKGSVIEKPGGEMFITVSNKRFGPYQDVELPLFSSQWQKMGCLLCASDDNGFLLLNGKEHGPFMAVERPEFSLRR